VPSKSRPNPRSVKAVQNLNGTRKTMEERICGRGGFLCFYCLDWNESLGMIDVDSKDSSSTNGMLNWHSLRWMFCLVQRQWSRRWKIPATTTTSCAIVLKQCLSPHTSTRAARRARPKKQVLYSCTWRHCVRILHNQFCGICINMTSAYTAK